MSSANQYYYERLNKEQRRAYHAIYSGLLDISASFPVLRLSPRELADIYFLVRMDHPEIFWSVHYSYGYYPDSEYVEMKPEYLFPKAKIREHQQAMTSRINKIVRQAESLKTDQEKEIYIHDFILSNVRYDKLKKAYSHEIIGSLGNGVAVCEGIAKAVKILCDRMGIWCIIALADNNPEKGIRYRHTWNVLKLGKSFYHLDATFDNTLSNGSAERPLNTRIPRYDYVNLSDTQIFRDHEPSIYPLPHCTDGNYFWYRDKKLSFTKTEEVQKRIQQSIRKKKPFVFHWRGGYLTREILAEIMNLAKEEADKKQKRAFLSLNWPQAVICIRFEELQEEEKGNTEVEMRMDQANEGELYDDE